MSSQDYQFVANGDSAISIMFNRPIGEGLSRKIITLKNFIEIEFSDQLKKNQLKDIIPAYQSLTICYDPLTIKKSDLIKKLVQLLKKDITTENYSTKTIEIPVCYESSFSPDLSLVAHHCQLNKQEIIELHTNSKYLVHMLGFLPGFLYLGGLNKKLSCPRKETPSKQIPAGSVAIGGEQTGIYPVDSPGGWHIIGQTPLKLFNPKSEQPFIAEPLDQVQFISITQKEFAQIRKKQEKI